MERGFNQQLYLSYWKCPLKTRPFFIQFGVNFNTKYKLKLIHKGITNIYSQ